MNPGLLIAFLIFACSGVSFAQKAIDVAQERDLKFRVTESAEWTDLFKRTNGWFGGDGIYSIPLSGVEKNGSSSKKTLFIFSDSMIGNLKNGKIETSVMIHNATAILKGNKPYAEQLIFNWRQNDRKNVSVFDPATPATGPEDYYWLGDGFVNQELNNTIYIFGYRIKQVGNGTFGFSEIGNTLIKIKHADAEKVSAYEQQDTPFHIQRGTESGSFGAGIYVNTKAAGAIGADGYLYVYGVFGKKKQLLVARVKPVEFENYSRWSFWNGSNWVAQMQNASAIATDVSNELSMSRLSNGKYCLIYQEHGIGKYVMMRIGESPIGPFGNPVRLWDCSPSLTKRGYFAYNAKAHPSLSSKGELLISYNVNSFDFLKDLADDPQFYRPRFITVKFKD